MAGRLAEHGGERAGPGKRGLGAGRFEPRCGTAAAGKRAGAAGRPAPESDAPAPSRPGTPSLAQLLACFRGREATPIVCYLCLLPGGTLELARPFGSRLGPISGEESVARLRSEARPLGSRMPPASPLLFDGEARPGPALDQTWLISRKNQSKDPDSAAKDAPASVRAAGREPGRPEAWSEAGTASAATRRAAARLRVRWAMVRLLSCHGGCASAATTAASELPRKPGASIRQLVVRKGKSVPPVMRLA
jgi:hypothetical protein